MDRRTFGFGFLGSLLAMVGIAPKAKADAVKRPISVKDITDNVLYNYGKALVYVRAAGKLKLLLCQEISFRMPKPGNEKVTLNLSGVEERPQSEMEAVVKERGLEPLELGDIETWPNTRLWVLHLAPVFAIGTEFGAEKAVTVDGEEYYRSNGNSLCVLAASSRSSRKERELVTMGSRSTPNEKTQVSL